MSVKQFSCDMCDMKEYCTEPKRTIFNKPRYWSYKGACSQYGKLTMTVASDVTSRTLDPVSQQKAIDAQRRTESDG